MIWEGNGRIEVCRGDITRLEVEAIVNAANISLLGGGGVDGAIHRVAGPELLAECRTIGGCPTGEARITKGYRLAANYVIHTVGPIFHHLPLDRAERLLTSCYESCLTLAVDHAISSIAFPAISCGAYGYPIEKASRVAIDTVSRFLEMNDEIRKVIFVLFSEEDRKIYDSHLSLRGVFVHRERRK